MFHICLLCILRQGGRETRLQRKKMDEYIIFFLEQENQKVNDRKGQDRTGVNRTGQALILTCLPFWLCFALHIILHSQTRANSMPTMPAAAASQRLDAAEAEGVAAPRKGVRLVEALGTYGTEPEGATPVGATATLVASVVGPAATPAGRAEAEAAPTPAPAPATAPAPAPAAAAGAEVAGTRPTVTLVPSVTVVKAS